MRTPIRAAALAISALALLAPTSHAQTPQKPWPIRAVIVTTFEVGHDTGDIPGEFQFWVEREHLSETLPFPGGPIDAARSHPAPTPSAPTRNTPSSASSAVPPSSTPPPP